MMAQQSTRTAVTLGADEFKEIEIRDREADFYDDWCASKGLWWNEVELLGVMSLLNLQQTDVVFDAGCGTGRVLVRVAPMVKQVIGVDYSPRSVQVLSWKLQDGMITNATGVVGNLTNLGLADESLDKIVSVQVIQHIPSQAKRIAVLREFRRVLKRGGTLFSRSIGGAVR